jgi:predicted transcriptional regulator
MNLSDEQRKFLLILSDGKKKTYVHISKGFGQPVTPMSPTFTNRIAGPLLKMGLIRHAGGGYKITEAGLSALRSGGSGFG